jgi:hypothetical protein
LGAVIFEVHFHFSLMKGKSRYRRAKSSVPIILDCYSTAPTLGLGFKVTRLTRSQCIHFGLLFIPSRSVRA